MMEILFVSSVQGYQEDREREIAERLKAEHTDVTVRLLAPEESGPTLAKYKLKFGPAVVINNRLEFVGIPRYRMLLERIEISKRRASAPPPAAASGSASPPAALPATSPPPASPRPAGPSG